VLENGVTTPIEGWLMLDKTTMKFSHVKPGDTDFIGEGLRDFFFYRDLGIAEATAGKVLAQLVRSNNAPEKGTGWHYHGADFHVVYMLKGWARFMYEDKETLVEAGDCVHQRPGIVHYLFDYSPDIARHGISGGRGASRFHDGRNDGTVSRTRAHAVEAMTRQRR
jgi:uncharacterized RmlC-like cupin family protein